MLLYLECLIALMAVNGAPVIAYRFLGPHGAWPIDGGRTLRDGQPLFGPSKTWRGLILAIGTSTALVPLLLGCSWWTGALFGTLVMIGDLISSFVKRRLQLEVNSRAVGLDQIPESALPLVICQDQLGLAWWDVIALVTLFLAIERPLSWVLFRLRIRKRPF